MIPSTPTPTACGRCLSTFWTMPSSIRPPADASRSRSGQGEYKAFIEIIDQGRGIPPEDLENVKTKFYKGSNSVRGSGIGLLVDDRAGSFGQTVVTLGLPLGGKGVDRPQRWCGASLLSQSSWYHAVQERTGKLVV